MIICFDSFKLKAVDIKDSNGYLEVPTDRVINELSDKNKINIQTPQDEEFEKKIIELQQKNLNSKKEQKDESNN